MSTPNKATRRLPVLIGYGIAAAALVWVLHDVDLGAVARSASSLRWGWVVPAILCDVFSYVCQGWRWEILLRPFGAVGVTRATQAIYAGLFANEVLPGRIGELVRGYLVHRWSGIAIPAVFATIVVERLLDGIWLALGIGLTAMTVRLPDELTRAGGFLGAVVLVGTALLVFGVWRARARRAAPPKMDPARPPSDEGLESSARAGDLLGRLMASLAMVGGSRGVVAALLASLGVPFFQGLSLWFLMVGFGFPLNLWEGIGVLLIVHFGTAIPNTPGNVGTYQFMCVVGLMLFGVDKPAAAAFSVIAFVMLTVPLWGLGFIAFARAGMTLQSVRREIGALVWRTHPVTSK